MIRLLGTINKRNLIFCSLLSILVALFVLSTPELAHADVPAPNAAGYLVQGSRGEFKEATVAIHIPQLDTSPGQPTITMSLTLGGVGQGLAAVSTQIVSSVDNNGHQTNLAQWSETVNNQTPKTGSLDGSITINPSDTVWLYVGSGARYDGPNQQGYNGFQVKDGTQTVTHYEPGGPYSDSGGASATLQATSPFRSAYPVAGFNFVVFVGFDVADTPSGATSATWKPIGQLTTTPQQIQQTPSGGGSPVIITDTLRKGPNNTDSDFDVMSK